MYRKLFAIIGYALISPAVLAQEPVILAVRNTIDARNFSLSDRLEDLSPGLTVTMTAGLMSA